MKKDNHKVRSDSVREGRNCSGLEQRHKGFCAVGGRTVGTDDAALQEHHDRLRATGLTGRAGCWPQVPVEQVLDQICPRACQQIPARADAGTQSRRGGRTRRAAPLLHHLYDLPDANQILMSGPNP